MNWQASIGIPCNRTYVRTYVVMFQICAPRRIGRHGCTLQWCVPFCAPRRIGRQGCAYNVMLKDVEGIQTNSGMFHSARRSELVGRHALVVRLLRYVALRYVTHP